jgi:hypothetical protein
VAAVPEVEHVAVGVAEQEVLAVAGAVGPDHADGLGAVAVPVPHYRGVARPAPTGSWRTRRSMAAPGGDGVPSWVGTAGRAP